MLTAIYQIYASSLTLILCRYFSYFKIKKNLNICNLFHATNKIKTNQQQQQGESNESRIAVANQRAHQLLK